jgi:hypothetical protein
MIMFLAFGIRHCRFKKCVDKIEQESPKVKSKVHMNFPLKKAKNWGSTTRLIRHLYLFLKIRGLIGTDMKHILSWQGKIRARDDTSLSFIRMWQIIG